MENPSPTKLAKPACFGPIYGESTLFVVCGEALFDVFAAGDTPAGMMLDARIGGSPFNVAMGLRRLGQPP